MLPALGWRVWFVRSTPSQAQCRALILRVSLADWALLLDRGRAVLCAFSRSLGLSHSLLFSIGVRIEACRSDQAAQRKYALQCNAMRVAYPSGSLGLRRNSGCVDVLTWIITLIRAIYRGKAEELSHES